jgi:hypothetical protein
MANFPAVDFFLGKKMYLCNPFLSSEMTLCPGGEMVDTRDLNKT